MSPARVRVTRDRFGGRRRGPAWSFFPLLRDGGLFVKDRYRRGKGGGGVSFAAGGGQGHPQIGRPAGGGQGRAMPARTAGRWGTGSPQARGPLRLLATGGGIGGRRTGSLQNGRPAGRCQGCPFLPGSPLGPNTFRTLQGGAASPLGRSRSARGARNSSGEAGGGRRRLGMGPAAATARWPLGVHHRGECGEWQQALWSCGRGVDRSMQSSRLGRLGHPISDPVIPASKKYIPHLTDFDLYTAAVRLPPPNRCSRGRGNSVVRASRCRFADRPRRRRVLPSPKR